MTLGDKKSKVTDFFQNNVGPESSPFCSLQTDTNFTIQTSKLCMFDSILSNRKQFPKCHRQLNTVEGNTCYNDEISCVKIENQTTRAALTEHRQRSIDL